MAKLKCPSCKSANVVLMRDDINQKIKHETSLNLNPLKPFTLTNTKEKRKKKTSAAKVGLAFLTGGGSMLVTGGLKKTAKNEFHCQNCGQIFTKKK